MFVSWVTNGRFATSVEVTLCSGKQLQTVVSSPIKSTYVEVSSPHPTFSNFERRGDVTLNYFLAIRIESTKVII